MTWLSDIYPQVDKAKFCIAVGSVAIGSVAIRMLMATDPIAA